MNSQPTNNMNSQPTNNSGYFRTMAYKATIFSLAIVILVMVIASVSGKLTFEIIFDKLIDSFMGTFIAVFLGGLVMDVLMRSEKYAEMQSTMSYIFHSKNAMTAFSSTKLEEITLDSMKARLGDKDGQLIFDTHIKRYTTGNKSFGDQCRTKYSYNIMRYDSWTINENSVDVDLLTDTQDYYAVASVLEYTKQRKAYTQGFNIAFAYKQNGLEQLNNDKVWFYREVLSLSDNDQSKVSKLSKDDLKLFAREVLGLQIHINKAPITSYVCTKELWGFWLHYDLSQCEGDDICGKIEVTIPRSNREKNFLVLFPDPTDSPKVSFMLSNKESIVNLNAITLLTIDSVKSYTSKGSDKLCKWEVDVDGWVFPTSGVVFIWP